MFLSAFAVSLPLLVKIYKEIGFLPFNFNLRKIVEDIYMGFPLVLSYIVDFILSVSDRYVIGIIISTAAVGFYNPAYTLGSILLLFPKICSEMVLFPLLSNAADKNKDNEMKIMVDYTIKIFLTIAIPFIVGSFFLSKPLLELFVNKETADKAYLAIPIVATGILFYGLTLIYSQMLLVRLETRVIFAINAVIAILNLVLNIILISIFKNILIAAITTLISYLIAFAIFHKVIKKYIFINYDFKIFVKCFFSSLVMGVFLLYFYVKRITSFIGVSLAISCAVFIYFLMLFFLKVFNEKEKTFIKDFFNIGKKLI
jgi:O-antigen/teichoic acid export membrane protein